MRPLRNITGGIAGLEVCEMKTRIISGAVLVVVLILVMLVVPTKLPAALLVGMANAIAANELLYTTGYVPNKRLVAYCAAMGFYIAIWSYLGSVHAYGVLGLLVFMMVLYGEMMFSHVKMTFDKTAMCFLAGAVFPYMLSSLIRIHIMVAGRHLIVIAFVLAFLSDTGAYFAGMAFGSHKLAPVLSPKKTIEGVLGGIIAAIVGMLVYGLIMQFVFKFRVNFLFAVLYGILGSGISVFGDLSFSVMKRQTGIKDYGNLIPGHGGILDRFDSVMYVAPLVEMLLLVLPVAVRA